MSKTTEIKTAKAVHGFKRVIVPDCPYCHEEHQHSESSEGTRMADCGQGMYILEFEGVQREQEVLKSMRAIVDYLYNEEEEHFEETPEADREKHIFRDIKVVDAYLKKAGV